jgi:hypothetical protein
MNNSPIIHINRKYHIELDNILSITKKRWGSVWVKYYDKTKGSGGIAIAKQDIGSLLNIINNYKIMRGLKPIIGIYEK